MSIDADLARIAELQSVLAPPVRATAGTVAPTAFASQLQAASPVATAALPGAGTSGGRPCSMRCAPPGSNDGARIAQYPQSTAGSGVGPWCAYFVCWAARKAGVPIGDVGQGFGADDGGAIGYVRLG